MHLFQLKYSLIFYYTKYSCASVIITINTGTKLSILSIAMHLYKYNIVKNINTYMEN